MTNSNPSSVDFDYESLKRRIAAASAEKENAEKARFSREYVEHCSRRFREAKAHAPKNSIAAVVQSERTQIALAGLVLVGFVIWIGHAFYVNYAEQNERAFAEKCSKNNFTYSSNNICYDERHHIHTLDSDGTARKGAFDWNVWRRTDFADKVANPNKAD